MAQAAAIKNKSQVDQQGFAFEAVEALLDFAFTQQKLKRIIAHSPEDRVASIRILEKLGMQQIARMKIC
ncbi:GNAT family N-acetyltransferase [Nostoc sp.]|uniref:GNAT family N-acetyltransferase n=1 Tax=Nostoc sp. TaxID=1180 RepID=UPI002FF70D8D